MPSILVVADDGGVRLTVRTILEREGYQVIAAADGEQGISVFEREAPHMIIIDILMPNKEGIATIMQIRAREPRIPIIAVSGGGQIGNIDFLKMALKVGADAILAKPFRRSELTEAVRRLLPI
jgi:CheY-like chemotaxis protein